MRASQGFRVLLRLQHHTALLIPGWVVNLWPCMYCVCVGERVCGCTSVKTLWWNALHHYLNCAPSCCSLLRLLLETLVGHGRIHVPRCIYVVSYQDLLDARTREKKIGGKSCWGVSVVYSSNSLTSAVVPPKHSWHKEAWAS